ncbi:YheC/YheD family protein [Paenibacillus sp. 7541]|uniref:YheC/YheD family endospore coat-associated protein n=1 Tax=Paenibacillus sp. 7541 TaxID=2026236 RepID=UPI000BA5BAAD|nr:YheC/YheD family protein [Paenibacillus sp. 7541]PAK48868.1 hypothetical protein CHH75_21975 [Paenibacillus sp. 7541]
MHPDYVGILLNNNLYRRLSGGRSARLSLKNYEEAAAMYGLVPCFTTIDRLSPEKGTLIGCIPAESGYVQVQIPIPRAIHLRAIYTDKRALSIIDRLMHQGIYVYNGRTRYGKDVIHRMLGEDPEMLPALPHTVRATPMSIREMIHQHGDLVLKPCSGSVGIAIMRLRASSGKYYLTYSRSAPSAKGWRTVRVSAAKLHPLIHRRISRAAFLVQERIQLAEYEGRPFDIRVTVQRGGSGEWEVTGMFAKTSPPRTFVSNIAQGGSAHLVPDILAKSLPYIPTALMLERLVQFALHTAHTLSRHIPFAADFGLDIGVTPDGKLYFIECNGCDQRYGFLEAGMDETWKQSYRTPMAFARYLYDRGAWPAM